MFSFLSPLGVKYLFYNTYGVPENFLKGHAYHSYSLTSADGSVQVTVSGSINLRCHEVSRSEAGHLIRFEVIDSGPGLSAEAQAQLFQPFHQVDDTPFAASRADVLRHDLVARIVNAYETREAREQLQKAAAPDAGTQ